MQIQIQNQIFLPTIAVGGSGPAPENEVTTDGGDPFTLDGGDVIILG